MSLLDEAIAQGARQTAACEVMGVHPTTIQRWRASSDGDDMRMGPITMPANALSKSEEAEILSVVNSKEFMNLSPKQIVPRLADQGRYLASESTIVRLLRRKNQNKHRGPKRSPSPAKPREKTATGPGQVWSWDISYLRGPIPGQFYYLYLALDVWSRKIVAAEVMLCESTANSSHWLTKAIAAEGVSPDVLTLHQDNGVAMKGTLKACLEGLGVLMSYSRPYVSDDNPYSESLFATMKTRPAYPRDGFGDIEQAQLWCAEFVTWYNEEHLHSSIGYVTPVQRHDGKSEAILAQRREVYANAKRRNPERWSGDIREWKTTDTVYLNPTKETLEMLRKQRSGSSTGTH